MIRRLQNIARLETEADKRSSAYGRIKWVLKPTKEEIEFYKLIKYERNDFLDRPYNLIQDNPYVDKSEYYYIHKKNYDKFIEEHKSFKKWFTPKFELTTEIKNTLLYKIYDYCIKNNIDKYGISYNEMEQFVNELKEYYYVHVTEGVYKKIMKGEYKDHYDITIYLDNRHIHQNSNNSEDSILSRASKIIYDRAEEKERQYGNIDDEMEKVATLFNTLTKKDLKTEDIYMIMICLKLARESVNHKEDNLLDLVAYTAAMNDYKNK